MKNTSIEEYELYFKKNRKTIENIVRYARIINKEEEINRQIEELVSTFLEVFQT